MVIEETISYPLTLRTEEDPFENHRVHLEIQGKFEDHISIYADGSKDQSQVAAAEVHQSSIITLKAQALFLA